MKFQYRWGLLLVGMALAWPTVGQNLSTDTLQLQEVVVSASKFRELKRRVPYQIEKIDASAIAFRNAQTSADVLVQSGQVFVQKSQAGGGSPVLRGFETNRIVLVVDGVRMNNAIFRAGHLQNVLRVDQNMLEGVEILYGPSSVVYGSDALGGVIHFKSKMPTLSTNPDTRFATTLLTRYASANNEFTNHIAVDIGKEKFGSLTSFTASDFGDVRQGAQRRDAYPDFGKRPDYVVQENGQDVIKANSESQRAKRYGLQTVRFSAKIPVQTFRPGRACAEYPVFQFVGCAPLRPAHTN